jgi:hypothetical protein
MASVLTILSPVVLFSLVTMTSCMTPVKRPIAAVPAEGTAKKVEDPIVDAATSRRRLWILPFENGTQTVSKELEGISQTQALYRALIKILGNPPSPFVTEESDVTALKDLSLTSASDMEEILEVAKGSGTSGFLKGKIVHFQVADVGPREGLMRSRSLEISVTVDFALYSNSSGREVYQGVATEKLTETRSYFLGSPETKELQLQVDRLMENLSDRMLKKLRPYGEKLGWQGRIVRMDGQRVFVNAGRRTGLEVGDVLEVIERQSSIRDPRTGVVLGEAPGRLKGTLRVVEYFGVDGAMTVLLSGGGITVGDFVQVR